MKCTQKQKAEEFSGQAATTRPETIWWLSLHWLAQPSSLQDEPKQVCRAEIRLEVPKVSSGMSSEEQTLWTGSSKQSPERVVVQELEKAEH